RRMGPQSPALAGRRRAAGAAVLLRQIRLHRDLPVRPGPRGGPTRRRRPRDAVRIAATGQAGDGMAAAALARYVDRLARALAGVINILDPEIIVLGGGLGQIAALYRDVPARWGAT